MRGGDTAPALDPLPDVSHIGDEAPDPLLSNPEYPEGAGPSDFTIQQEPFCHRIKELPKFVRVRGGAYFFLPGRRALRYLAGLAPDQR